MDDEPNYDLSTSVSSRAETATARSTRRDDGSVRSAMRWANVERAIVKAVTELLQRQRVPSARIHFAIVSDPEIARLNTEFLGRDGPTDVLSFDLRDRPDLAACGASADGGTTASATGVEGDVVLSAETAEREAADRGHGITAELALYAVHGVLHLLGYDDATAQDAQRMHQLEDEALSACGLGRVYESTRGCRSATGGGGGRPTEAVAVRSKQPGVRGRPE